MSGKPSGAYTGHQSSSAVREIEKVNERTSCKRPAKRESHSPSITSEPTRPEDSTMSQKYPTCICTCRWGASCSWRATAVAPRSLGTLVAERGQLSGTSGHVVMLMVMDAPGAQSALRSSVLCSRSEWRRGRSSENELAKSQWLKRVRRQPLGLFFWKLRFGVIKANVNECSGN